MGNKDSLCCISRDKESYILSNELVIFREFKKVLVRVKLGDILKESGEGVVCLYHNPDKTPLLSLYTPTVREHFKISYEQMFIQNLELEFYRLITYYHVKLFENDKDLFQYYNAYKECLQHLNDEGVKEILIADCPNRAHRAFSAEVLVRSVMDFIEETNCPNIKQITIMNSDKKNTRFLKYELIKYIEESQQPQIRRERQSKFMKFITSTRSITSEMRRQNGDLDFSINDFDLGDESKLQYIKEQ